MSADPTNPTALPHEGEPLSLRVVRATTPEAYGTARLYRFEYSSRGDRVPGRLFLPAKPAGPRPLVLVVHGAGASKEAAHLEVTARWCEAGAAIAAIDLPLHGERASVKLTERLLTSLAEMGGDRPGLDPETRVLWDAFADQAVADMSRALDALSLHAEVDVDRTTFFGLSLGAMLGARFCARDPRPRAYAGALCGGGVGPAHLDPSSHIGGIAGRPVLIIGAEDDARVPRSATEHLFAAAGEPKSLEFHPGDHEHLPGAAFKRIWGFLQAASA